MLSDSSKKVFSTLPRWVKSVGVIATGFTLFFVAQFIGAVFFSTLLVILGADPDNLENLLSTDSFLQFGMIACVEVFTVLGVVFFLHLAGRRISILNWAVLKPKQLAKTFGYFAIYFLSIYLVTIFIAIFVPAIDVDQAQQIGFENARNGDLIWVFLSLCVAAPIGEEVLFRGFLYRSLKKYCGMILAAFVTTILFGIAHLEFGSGTPLNWIAAIDTAVFSLALIYVYEKEKTIWAPITMHMLKNSLAFIFLFVIA